MASPLLRRALTRSLAREPSVRLQLVALVLLATAAAATPVFGEASANAALGVVLDDVPSDARAADDAVVRLNGGVEPADAQQARFLEALDDLPGMGTPVVQAFSIGLEIAPPRSIVIPVVETDGTDPVRARLAGVADPAAVLDVVAAGGPDDGVWLPVPVADQLGVGPGDDVRLAVDRLEPGERVPAVVAGTYRVGTDGRRPADPAGRSGWAELRGAAPRDSVDPRNPAFLVVTDLGTAAALAAAVGDELLWSAQVEPDPARPTLAQAQETSAAVQDLRREVLVPGSVALADGPLRPGIYSGLEGLVEQAERLSAATQDVTRPVGRAGVLLGLGAVLAAAGLTVRRRSGELRAAAGIGVPVSAQALLAVVEQLPRALVGLVAGTGLATAVVVLVGPPGAVTSTGVRAGVLAALVALGLSLAGVAAVQAAAAVVAARPVRPTTATRARPWPAALVLLAAGVVAGLLTRPASARGLGPVDLLAPLLLAAATGAVGAVLLARSARRVAVARARRGRPVELRRAVGWLAWRRAAAPGDERAVVVTLAATGLSVLMFAQVSVTSVGETVDDRVAVEVGATASTRLPASWLLDPEAPPRPAPDEADAVTTAADLPPGLRVPPVPDGQTVVWRSRSSVGGLDGPIDLLVVDPATFGRAADWGATGALEPLRRLLPRMAELDAAAAATLREGLTTAQVPAVVVGDVGLDLGDGQVASVDTDLVDGIVVQVLDVVPVAPVKLDRNPVLVLGADSFLLQLLTTDPRLRPAVGFSGSPSRYRAELWSSAGPESLTATLDAAGLDVDDLVTAAEERNRPSFVAARAGRDYQLALAVVLALLSALALCLYADRATARDRAGDVLLARTGLGTARLARARTAELALMGLAATALALLGTLTTAPLASRLLEPGGGGLPPARMVVHPVHVLVLAGAGLVVVVAAVVAARLRVAAATPAEVLRDA